jgi:hypothetical protein
MHLFAMERQRVCRREAGCLLERQVKHREVRIARWLKGSDRQR